MSIKSSVFQRNRRISGRVLRGNATFIPRAVAFPGFEGGGGNNQKKHFGDEVGGNTTSERKEPR